MRQSWMVGVAAALAIAVLPALSSAQVRSDPGKAAKAMKEEATGKRQLFERIRPIYLERLSEELELDEATREKMAQSFDQFRGQYRALRKERKALAAKLRSALESGAPDVEIEAILGEYDAFRERHHQLRAYRQSETLQILGTRRYAQYVLFQQKFRREIRKMLHKRRKKKDQG